jgi:hypothetical protein
MITILIKEDLVSTLSLITVEVLDGDFASRQAVIIKNDPRQQILSKSFDKFDDADEQFKLAINQSLFNGWTVAYKGKPLYG